MSFITHVRVLSVLGALISPCAFAGYAFEAGDVKGEATLAAGVANINASNVNFGAGRVDLRNGRNTGERADWQEMYLKPGATLSYEPAPGLEVFGGASAVGAATFGDGDAGGYTRSSDHDLSIEAAYAGIRQGDWSLSAGRQDFKVGTGFIVMDGNLDFFNDGAYWIGPRTAFRDSAIVRYGHDRLSAQAFSLRTDDDLGDFRMNGLNVDYDLAGAVTLGAMAIGLIYRLPAQDHFKQLGLLMFREIDANPPTNVPRWISVKTEAGVVRALVFVAARDGMAYAGKLPMKQVAQVLARAAGHWGSAAQYLFRTVTMMKEHGIRDRNMWRLQSLVAQEIEECLCASEKS